MELGQLKDTTWLSFSKRATKAMATVLKHFYKTFLNSLDAGDAAIFIGAGMSRPSGFVDWKELLREVAEEVGLDVDKESDLIAVAQYHLNAKSNRARLNQKLIEEFTKDAKPSENHRLIASLSIRSIWTSNYDTLIEDAFKELQKRPDVKSTQPNLSQSVPGRDVTIYKMHGDISQPQDAVLTKDDYETYATKRGLFIEKLQGDLVSKTFLFLGFSFTDPNIDYILARLRVFLGQNPREHFCIMRQPHKPKGGTKTKAYAQYEYDKRKHDLRIADLSRYGITSLNIDEYSEITDVLRELNRRGHRKDIFVSGSAYDFDPFGQKRLEGLARLIGSEIIRRNYNLTSGFGLGIGGAVIIGAMEALYEQEKGRQEGRTNLRPFPQVAPGTMTKQEFNTKYRKDMISQVGAVIFIAGNKLDSATGKVSEATGVNEEFRIAKQSKRLPIPVGATGHAAAKIWNDVTSNLAAFFPLPNKVKKYFDIIGNASKSNDEIVQAVFAIIEVANAD